MLLPPGDSTTQEPQGIITHPDFRPTGLPRLATKITHKNNFEQLHLKILKWNEQNKGSHKFVPLERRRVQGDMVRSIHVRPSSLRKQKEGAYRLVVTADDYPPKSEPHTTTTNSSNLNTPVTNTNTSNA